MLSMEFIKTNRADVDRAIRDKGVSVDVDALLALDAEARALKTEIDNLRAARNAISARFKDATPEEKAVLGAEAKAAGARASELESQLGGKQDAINALMMKLPGIPWDGAPVGPDESFNKVIRTEGEVPNFGFEPLDHVALIEKNDWADLSRIVQVSGSRTYCLKGRLALLETKLMGWALDRIATAGFTAITVPAIAREQAFLNQGQFPGHVEETYALPNDDAYLAGTAEVALTSLHSGEIVDGAKLPILYAGYSPCFRREAGSAGKDVRGLLRVHQFLKVEQWVMCDADPAVSAEWHEKLLGLAEQLLTALEIPYQVIETSTGDMGLGKYRMNDIESWVPSLGKYRETHSCSTLHDWQARRANLRYRDSEGKVRFAHTLNNTALASPRILVPLLENHQTVDGRVRLPKALRDLMGGDEYL
ncbi:serine--tRNA ligase [Sphingomonas edaphi]|uniref:Serine--tRNA ligase n=1 Tax=Sphingomonas edaphi TaxID=2315689 RepID=A0A418PYA4_9SPHN|nr:serine--tRNA ligase [Sphingomonas edaphi]RIX26875.1 serine--tRNA ligase [Sphingomonas edaphi]